MQIGDVDYPVVEAILFLTGTKTMTERLIEESTKAYYDLDLVLANFNSPDRFIFNLIDLDLMDESLGFTTSYWGEPRRYGVKLDMRFN